MFESFNQIDTTYLITIAFSIMTMSQQTYCRSHNSRLVKIDGPVEDTFVQGYCKKLFRAGKTYLSVLVSIKLYFSPVPFRTTHTCLCKVAKKHQQNTRIDKILCTFLSNYRQYTGGKCEQRKSARCYIFKNCRHVPYRL